MGRLNETAGPEAADAWLGMGDAEYFQSNYDQANANYEKGLELARKAGYQHGMAVGLKDMGNIRHVHGDWDGALDLYAKSLQVSEAAGDKEAMARVLSNMGLMYSQKRNDDKSARVLSTEPKAVRGDREKRWNCTNIRGYERCLRMERAIRGRRLLE